MKLLRSCKRGYLVNLRKITSPPFQLNPPMTSGECYPWNGLASTSTKLDQFETNGLQQLSILVSTINPSLPLEDPTISSVIVQDEVATNPHEDMSRRLGLSSWISVTPAHIQHGSSTRSILAIDKISKDKLSPTCVFSKKMLLSTIILGLLLYARRPKSQSRT